MKTYLISQNQIKQYLLALIVAIFGVFFLGYYIGAQQYTPVAIINQVDKSADIDNNKVESKPIEAEVLSAKNTKGKNGQSTRAENKKNESTKKNKKSENKKSNSKKSDKRSSEKNRKQEEKTKKSEKKKTDKSVKKESSKKTTKKDKEKPKATTKKRTDTKQTKTGKKPENARQGNRQSTGKTASSSKNVKNNGASAQSGQKQLRTAAPVIPGAISGDLPATPIAPGTSADQLAGNKRHYSIQAGMFASKVNAASFINKLAEKNFEAYVSDFISTSGTVKYNVRVGRFEQRDQARELLREFQKSFSSPAYVVITN